MIKFLPNGEVDPSFYGREYFDPGPQGGLKSYCTLTSYKPAVERRRIDALFQVASPRCLLDVGCGKGYFLRALLDVGGVEVFGCDVSRYALSFLDKRLQDKVFCASVVDRPRFLKLFQGKGIDTIFSCDVLEHIRDVDGALLSMLGLMPEVMVHQIAGLEEDEDLSHVTLRGEEFWREKLDTLGYSTELKELGDFRFYVSRASWL